MVFLHTEPLPLSCLKLQPGLVVMLFEIHEALHECLCLALVERYTRLLFKQHFQRTQKTYVCLLSVPFSLG